MLVMLHFRHILTPSEITPVCLSSLTAAPLSKGTSPVCVLDFGTMTKSSFPIVVAQFARFVSRTWTLITSWFAGALSQSTASNLGTIGSRLAQLLGGTAQQGVT